jgi:hypothetical protein
VESTTRLRDGPSIGGDQRPANAYAAEPALTGTGAGFDTNLFTRSDI